MYHNCNFHVIKRKDCFIGNNSSTGKPTVFAFRKKYHAVKVKHWYDIYEYDIKPLDKDQYSMNVHIPRRERSEDCIIETNGYFDTQIRMSLNNVHMFIVDDIIEDDDGNIFLFKRDDPLIPVEVTNKMYVTHLNYLYMLDKKINRM
jgi:hypothetical protein